MKDQLVELPKNAPQMHAHRVKYFYKMELARNVSPIRGLKMSQKSWKSLTRKILNVVQINVGNKTFYKRKVHVKDVLLTMFLIHQIRFHRLVK